MDCSPPGSSVHGILQVRILEWVAIPSSKGSSWPRDRTWISCIADEVSIEPPGKPKYTHNPIEILSQHLLFRWPPQRETIFWKSQRQTVLICNLLVVFCVAACCQLGWLVHRQWKHVGSVLISCSVFSVTWLYSPVLCSSFCFSFPPKGKRNVYDHDVLCLAGKHKNFCSVCLHFWLR